MKLKKEDCIFLILIAIITIVSIDLLVNEYHREAIENISKYPPFQNLASGLLITFIICFIGNILPFPTPYTFVVCFSSLPFLQINLFVPFLVGFIASLGCLVGELGGYFLGRGAAQLISEQATGKLKSFQLFLVENPKIAPFLIFIAALTPISDDFITIPLGMLKYSVKKTIFWCWLGKLGLMLIFAYNLINICQFLGGENWILSILSLYFLVVMVYLMIKIDLIDLFKKLLKSKAN